MLYKKNLYYLLCSCINPIFTKNLVPKIEPKMLSANQIARFKSIVSPEQIDETVSFVACWYNVTKFKSFSENCWLSMVKNGWGQSGLCTLKLTISQEWTDGINWFFTCRYKLMKIERRLKIFRVTEPYNILHLKNEQMQ